MDAADDDQDVKLQRASANLLADFQSSLRPFLWKTSKLGESQIRNRVRSRDTERLVNLLEPFQELPQLLDPHLDNLVPVLADAFLASLQAPYPKHAATNAHLLMPLSKAICKLLYTFCKIRGDKVIVRFWSTETRYLELLLTAIESHQGDGKPSDENALAWDWAERYITLLWLSQLLLAPFDLASISSRDAEDTVQPEIPGLIWPDETPAITVRAIALGIRYLSSSGKERDAAKTLLVRIAMRRDMQALGIQDALMQWALSSLHANVDEDHTTYHFIGILSFLAAILISSVGTTNMDPFVSKVFTVIQRLTVDESAVFELIRGSAVARKAIVKILRTIVVLLLQTPDPDDEVIEFTIGHMLESLADSATPVRLAASKALSIITLKLPSDMSTQVIEEVLDSLKKNLLWSSKSGSSSRIRNLSRVNPLEWHGLTLTLSHLLYRQSIPAADLAPVLDALRLALSFEQRSTSGSSIGTNVRDAACFGIWAVARRYRTADLQNIRLSPDITVDSLIEANVSSLQTLANDLVVSACVDPAGNIRRGSSAALQELIGRHPNTIAEGIAVVQVVDYHAVALRTRAMSEVAMAASKLSEEYHESILKALLGWRGVRDENAASRKVAAGTIGELVWQRHLRQGCDFVAVDDAVGEIARQIEGLEAREMGERHGLVLAFSGIAVRMSLEWSDKDVHTEVHRHWKYMASKDRDSSAGSSVEKDSGLYLMLKAIKSHITGLLKTFQSLTQNTRNMELLAEAFSELVIATSWTLTQLCAFRDFGTLGKLLGTTDDGSEWGSECTIQNSSFMAKPGDEFDKWVLDTQFNLLTTFMKNGTVITFATLTEAAEKLVLFEGHGLEGSSISSLLAGQWIKDVASSKGKKDLAYIHALIKLFPILSHGVHGPATGDVKNEDWQTRVMQAIQERWRRDTDVETRASILQCLARAKTIKDHETMIESHPASFIDMIQEGLQDFTTNARGDVGSLVRIAAAEAAGSIVSRTMGGDLKERVEVKLVGGLLRIAGEKLDKVRIEGQRVVACLSNETTSLATLNCSSQAYFSALLNLQTQKWWKECPNNSTWATNLLEGYVTSADTGSEDLVRASRAALVEFCDGENGNGNGNGNGESVCRLLCEMVKGSGDRVLVPALEVVGFLFDMGVMRRYALNWKSFYTNLQKAHYKSTNVRKLTAAIKIYGGLMEVFPEAGSKLSGMLLHGYPQVRNAAVDELWVVCGDGDGNGGDGGGGRTGVEGLKGVDWGALRGEKGKERVQVVREELGRWREGGDGGVGAGV